MSEETAVAVVGGGVMALDQAALAALGMTEEQLAVSGTIGLENARPEDFQIPRLNISQSMSPQLIRSKPEYIPGLMVGQFFNTVTQEIYGDTVLVVPVKYTVSRLKFTSNVLDCQSKNGVNGGHYSPEVITIGANGKQTVTGGCKDCQYSKWGSGKDGQGTDCKEYRNWLLLSVKGSSPMSMSFKSASLTVAKIWATLIQGRKIALSTGEKITAPAFMTVYELRSAEKSTTKGTFYVPQVRVVEPTQAVLIKAAAAFYKSFSGEIISDVGHDD